MIDERIERFRSCYTSVVHDVMRAAGKLDFTLPSRIRPLQPEMTLCGPAFTIEGRPELAADPHETLLEWTGLLSKCPEGHIWTAQPHTSDLAQMGELSAETLHKKGVLGCVLDGALRDSNFILKLGFPCWRTHHTPKDVVGSWLPTGINEGIRIGDVSVRPGDWLHGDRDGMVRVPAADVDDILEKSIAAMETENKVRTAILAGTDPQDAYRKYGKF